MRDKAQLTFGYCTEEAIKSLMFLSQTARLGSMSQYRRLFFRRNPLTVASADTVFVSSGIFLAAKCQFAVSNCNMLPLQQCVQLELNFRQIGMGQNVVQQLTICVI